MPTRDSGAESPHPMRINAALAAFYFAVNLYQFFILPQWLLPRNVGWAWTLLPLVLLNNSYWSLIHEAIHDLFHPAPKVNRVFGRVAAVVFGAPFRVLRLSHLLHHKLNRTPKEATELFDRRKSTRRRAAAGYFLQIFGGLYFIEFLSSVVFFLPLAWLRAFTQRFVATDSVSGLLMQNWTKEDALREIRVDGALVLGWMGLSLWCYGEHWPLLLGLVAARGFFISFLDNVYHYRTPVNEVFYAGNLRLPGPVRKLLLNFNLHGIHHQNPAVPWSRLPVLFARHGGAYQGGYFVAALRQLRGPLTAKEILASSQAGAS